MAFDLGDELKKLVLAGIGAVAMTAEKSKEIIDDLVKKGEVTVEEGKVMNEELSRKMKEKVHDVVKDTCNGEVTVTVVKKEEQNAQDICHHMEKLSMEDLETIKAKLAELEKDRDQPKE